jgi:hypothetical protein
MKTPLGPRTGEGDDFDINAKTRHQYYETVQSEEHPEHLLDAAMSRRQKMALRAHRRGGRAGWLGWLALVLAGLAAGAVWLLN